MDVTKQPGRVMEHQASAEDMALINRLAKTALAPEQVYTFAVRLCDNEVDRDFERFDIPALTALGELLEGGGTAVLYMAPGYLEEFAAEMGLTMPQDIAAALSAAGVHPVNWEELTHGG